MSGPTAGLPAGYPAPPASTGLMPQQAGPYVYGRMTSQNRPDMNPLNSRPAMLVKNAARKRLNEYLRAQGLPPFQEHEEIPAMFILIELMHMTMEPLRTDANRAFRDMPVKLSTSQVVRTVWRRLPYESVPYEARTFPFHVARMMLHQIENYSYTIYPELVQAGNMQMWQARPLSMQEAVQVAPVRWRPPTKQEEDAMNAMANRLSRSDGIASRRQGGQGNLLVALNPERDRQPMNAKHVAESPHNPDVQTFQPPQAPHRAPAPTPEYPQPQVMHPAPPPPASSQQYAQTAQGQQQMQPQHGQPPQMMVDPQAATQQRPQSTSMRSDLHDPLNAQNEIPETVRRTQQGQQPTPEDKQEALPTGHVNPEATNRPTDEQLATSQRVNNPHLTVPMPPTTPAQRPASPPPPPPPPTR